MNRERVDADTLNLQVRVVQTNKVFKTHKGGKTASWNVLVVVGDGNGNVGAALGKARGVPDAIRKGEEAAKKSMMKIPTLGSTLPHEVIGKQGASEVILRPASPGTGVVAGGAVRAILECAGIRDVLGKSLGSRNAINTAWATMRAIQSIKDPEDAARNRNTEVDNLMPWYSRTKEGANA